MGANETQIGGDHYKTGGEEHWDRVHRLGLDYFQGQITKYIERWKKKGGLQDLHKARHFLDKYIELESAKCAKKEDQRAVGMAPTRAQVDEAIKAAAISHWGQGAAQY